MLIGLAADLMKTGWDDDLVAPLILVVWLTASRLVILYGSIKMFNANSYVLALTATGLTLFPCSMCWCPFVGLGVWSLVVLWNGQVRSALSWHAALP
jgi:hypothetical protein